MYKNLMPEGFISLDNHSPGTISKNISPQPAKPVLTKNQYDIIVKRNLFKVEVEAKEEPSGNQEPEDKEPEKLEATNLKLVLWGTVTGESEVYAVIEDKKMRQQGLYDVGDSIQGAKVKKILKHEVILTYQGKDQILEMETDNKNVSRPGIPTEEINFNPVSINKPLINDLPDISTLMRQVKFRPHFTEGEPDGLMVYGIRPNSVFRQMGLRNGDIIKDINGTSILSAEDASSLFREIEGADNAKVTLFRRGQVKELIYQAKDGKFLKSKGDE
ncbi:MAG: hypothetical protein K8S18_03590 [Desulfobacula sp.]|nr:hypothetical protein [Desulfobacula sp.]